MPEPETSLTDTIDRVLHAVIRRRWWFLLSAAAIALATALAPMLIPNRYTSEATLLVVQQQVPERYVASTTTTEVSEALQAMTQEVVSRTRMAAIISEFGLYREEKQRLAPERVIELMRQSIEIQPIEDKQNRRGVNAFKIAFTANAPDLAQKVTSRLTSLFIAENLKTREDQAENTAKFLDARLEEAKTKLDEQQKLVRDFKMQHLGELPEQQQGNVTILAGLNTQLQNTAAGLSRAQEQQVYLESLLRGYEGVLGAQVDAPAAPGAVTPTSGPLQDAQLELVRVQAERARLLVRYTPGHPDILRMDREIEKAKALVDLYKSSAPPRAEPAPAPRPVVGAAERGLASSVAQVNSQLQANRVEIENLTRDYKNLRSAIEQYQSRLNQTPVREQQLAGILRDHDLYRQDYADLLRKKLEAELATNLEKQQAGRQFRLVDAPSLPTLPTSPNRRKISLVGAVAGLAVGMAAVLFVDSKDRSFQAEKAVSQRFASALVVGIPLLLTRAERRARAWGKALQWFAGTVLALMVLAAEFYVYRQG